MVWVRLNLMQVRIAGIVHESVTDGPGLRTTLFFQGCPHACRGCHNPQTWSFSGGQIYDLETWMAGLAINPIVSGATFSGGEPFAQAEAAARIAAYVRSRRMNLWVYTGYVWETLLTRLEAPGYADLLNRTDVLVDGPYQQENRSLSLPFRGSSNQRLIRVQESLQTGQVVEWRP